MTLTELLTVLNDRDLRLRRDSDQIAVVGDVGKLTADVKAAMKDHKADLLDLLPEPRPRPPWWSEKLSDTDNQAVDNFMGYGPAGPTGEDDSHEIALADVAPCRKCGSLWAWWDFWGGQHCRTCDPPAKSVRLARKARQLREKHAAENAG